MFDLRTSAALSGVISFILCLCFIYVLRTRKTYPGFRQWTLSSILFSVALGLLSMRSMVSDFFSVIVANGLIFAGIGCVVYGLELFVARKGRFCFLALLGGAMILLFLYFMYVVPSVYARIITISVVLIPCYLYAGYVVYRYVPRLIKEHNRLLEVAFIAQAVWLIIRIVQTVIVEMPIRDFMGDPSFQWMTMLVFICCNILLTLGFIILTVQRVEFDLSTAVDEIKILQGLISICSSCKKIRDDRGGWKQIEIYIRDHSEAEFSHGICPDCAKKLYPDMDLDD
ncbi:MAG: hypothetical protein EOL87_06235 [Spartobacteria bacterium]|nr:hypothetical protein [Spartobacteria bacterium]